MKKYLITLAFLLGTLAFAGVVQAMSVQVDYITITVYYTTASGTPLGTSKFTVKSAMTIKSPTKIQ